MNNSLWSLSCRHLSSSTEIINKPLEPQDQRSSFQIWRDITRIRTLPASLQTTRTLRILELTFTGLGAFARSQSTGWAQVFCDADERNRRDAILRPLSLAIPDLRFRLHSDDNDDFPEDSSIHWWHARCGHDWWDPVFGSPDPPPAFLGV